MMRTNLYLLLSLIFFTLKPPCSLGANNHLDTYGFRKGDKSISIEYLGYDALGTALGFKTFFSDNQAVQIFLGISSFYHWETEPGHKEDFPYSDTPYKYENLSMKYQIGFKYVKYFLSYKKYNMFYAAELAFGMAHGKSKNNDTYYNYPNLQTRIRTYRELSVKNCYTLGFETPITDKIHLNVQAGTYLSYNWYSRKDNSSFSGYDDYTSGNWNHGPEYMSLGFVFYFPRKL